MKASRARGEWDVFDSQIDNIFNLERIEKSGPSNVKFEILGKIIREKKSGPSKNLKMFREKRTLE